MGVRAGFVYKTEDDLIGIYVPGRSVLNGAYSVPFPFTDIGARRRRAAPPTTATLTLFGMPVGAGAAASRSARSS